MGTHEGWSGAPLRDWKQEVITTPRAEGLRGGNCVTGTSEHWREGCCHRGWHSCHHRCGMEIE